MIRTHLVRAHRQDLVRLSGLRWQADGVPARSTAVERPALDRPAVCRSCPGRLARGLNHLDLMSTTHLTLVLCGITAAPSADSPRDRDSCEVCRHVLRHPLPRGAKEVLGDIAHVWGDDDVVERSEGVIPRERLTVEDFDTGTAELTATESLDNGPPLDARTARALPQAPA